MKEKILLLHTFLDLITFFCNMLNRHKWYRLIIKSNSKNVFMKFVFLTFSYFHEMCLLISLDEQTFLHKDLLINGNFA